MIAYWLHFTLNDTIIYLLLAVGAFVSGILTFFYTANYTFDKDGEQIYYEPEGTFMYLGVNYWVRIFFFIAGVSLFIAAGRIFSIF